MDAGGAEYLATHLKTLSTHNPNTLIVAAGDLIGASPLLSSMFGDQPAIRALNEMGIDVSSVGNHEFDNGWQELLRVQNGCDSARGCGGHTPFTAASFKYLAANVTFDPRVAHKSGSVLPAYDIKTVGGIRIGIIGLTLRATPQLVMRSGVEGLRFESESASANRWVRVLRSQRVRAIVVLIHEGGVPAGDDPNACDRLEGPITQIARQISDDVDVIVSGHTHRAYTCTIDGKLVTSAASFGRLITAVDLTLDSRTGDVVKKTARNIPVTRDVQRDPVQTAIIEEYRPMYAAVANRVVGTIARDVTRAPNEAGESALGALIADGTLSAGALVPDGHAVVAFMNPGGIRADLVHGGAPGTPRPVTYAEAFTVLPFRNRVIAVTMTGAAIKDVLEQQFDNIGPGQDRMLQVSRGFAYSYDRTRLVNQRVDAASITIQGNRVEARQRYRVVINEFIASGGDNFSGFTKATGEVTVGNDLDIFASYLQKHSPVDPPPLNRIKRSR
jgi:5'-nucleotidase